jgi:antitoxin (DNA-binding transcriptional repressor) of toxin-antitoxin stability system
VLAKDGRPWARLVPLDPAPQQRRPGALAGRITLPPAEELMAPLPPDELSAWDS